jgi:hypothetical protein
LNTFWTSSPVNTPGLTASKILDIVRVPILSLLKCR